jgi:predicted ester cyclase
MKAARLSDFEGGSMKTKFSVFLLVGVLLVMVSTQGYAEKTKLDLKKIADKIVKTIRSGDPVAITNLYAQDAVMIQSGEPAPVRGHAALLTYYQGNLRAFPDAKGEFSSIFFSGDTIIFEGVGHCTFTGPMGTPEGDVAPTGKRANFRFVFLAKISPDGLIAEDRTYFDNLDLMKQLGLIN